MPAGFPEAIDPLHLLTGNKNLHVVKESGGH